MDSERDPTRIGCTGSMRPPPTLVLGDPIGPSAFDPRAARLGSRIVSAHRVRAARVAALRGDLARIRPDASLHVPLVVVAHDDDAASAAGPLLAAVPLPALVGSGAWLTTTTAHALLFDLAGAVRQLHRCGVAAGWLGPEAVLVDAFGGAGLDLALTIGHRRPGAGPGEDAAGLAVLAGWLARRQGLALRSGVAELMDEALLGQAARDGNVGGWLRRLRAATERDAAQRAAQGVISLADAARCQPLEAICERQRAAVLAAPDPPRVRPGWRWRRPRSGWW